MDIFGKLFTLTDWGSSHGEALYGEINGCPKGIIIDNEFINNELNRRAPSKHPNSTCRKESDAVIFLSGIDSGCSTGEAIQFKIPNGDVVIDEKNLNIIRPSHASYTYKMKYGITDNSGIERASARQTVCRVVAGAIAKLILKKYDISIAAEVGITGEPVSADDTFGATVCCKISGLPPGLGEPVYDKFDARLAYAMMSINASKGFEIGRGFEAAKMHGSQYNDLQNNDFSFQTNNDGGVQAGITNGEPVYFSVAFKPIPTLQKCQHTIDFEGNNVDFIGNNRNDKSVVPRVLPVVEAMAAMVVVDFLLQNKCIYYE